jgi:hypothetical protein
VGDYSNWSDYYLNFGKQPFLFSATFSYLAVFFYIFEVQTLNFCSVKPCSVYQDFEGISCHSVFRVDIYKKIICFLRNIKDSQKYVLVHFPVCYITKYFFIF